MLHMFYAYIFILRQLHFKLELINLELKIDASFQATSIAKLSEAMV